MQECVIEVERRIKRNKQRLDQNKDEESTVNPVSLKILKAKIIQGIILRKPQRLPIDFLCYR